MKWKQFFKTSQYGNVSFKREILHIASYLLIIVFLRLSCLEYSEQGFFFTGWLHAADKPGGIRDGSENVSRGISIVFRKWTCCSWSLMIWSVHTVHAFVVQPSSSTKDPNPQGSCYVSVLIAVLLQNFSQCLQDTQANKRALAVRYIWMHCSSKGIKFRTACC